MQTEHDEQQHADHAAHIHGCEFPGVRDAATPYGREFHVVAGAGDPVLKQRQHGDDQKADEADRMKAANSAQREQTSQRHDMKTGRRPH